MAGRYSSSHRSRAPLGTPREQVPNWPVQLTDPIIRRGAEEAEAPASKEPEPAADVAEEPAKEPEKEPEPDHPPLEVAPPDNGATDVEPAKEEPETAPEPAAVDELAADTAAPAESEAAKPGSTVQRTLLRVRGLVLRQADPRFI